MVSSRQLVIVLQFRVSIFADDVVLFLTLSVGVLVTMRELLRVFGKASGLLVNYRKTSATII
jgi:hypothetical protein